MSTSRTFCPIDELIEKLTEIRDGLPEDCRCRAQAPRRRDIRTSANYLLLPPADRRGGGNREALRRREREAKQRELERLQAELGVVCYAAPGKRGTLRIVA